MSGGLGHSPKGAKRKPARPDALNSPSAPAPFEVGAHPPCASANDFGVILGRRAPGCIACNEVPGTEKVLPAERSESGRAAGGGPLPCLNSHNSTQENKPKLTGSAAKTAYALTLNIEALCNRYGINQIGFLTLTFSDHVLKGKEAQRRFNSLATHVLRDRYQAYIRVLERHKSGRIHYHLLVVMPDGIDIRTGFDFEAVSKKDYRSASPAIRAEWAFLRKKLKEYRFGRAELHPIRSTSEGIAKYVGKYISKHINQRESLDKGLRLVEYSRGAKIANSQFAWNSPGSKMFRSNLGALIKDFYALHKIPSPTTRGMRAEFGPRWAWKWRDSIMK